MDEEERGPWSLSTGRAPLHHESWATKVVELGVLAIYFIAVAVLAWRTGQMIVRVFVTVTLVRETAGYSELVIQEGIGLGATVCGFSGWPLDYCSIRLLICDCGGNRAR